MLTREPQAFEYLTDGDNEYYSNLLNLKIESPYDDNFSDDELTFLPYYIYLTSTSDPAKYGLQR